MFLSPKLSQRNRPVPSQSPATPQGVLPYRASRRDPRFSYCLYLPPGDQSTDPGPLLVLVHDSERDAAGWRDRFMHFARQAGVALMAPLFPAGLPDPRDWENFADLQRGSVHFDQALLAMVDEVVAEYGVDERFLLFGFGAGGSFAQRFGLCYPERLRALSVAAPAGLSLPDPGLDWPVGVGGVAEHLGVEMRWGALQKLAVHLVVGAETPASDQENPTPGASVAEAQQLSQAYWRRGVAVRLDIVPGVHRCVQALIPASQVFFRRVLRDEA